MKLIPITVACLVAAHFFSSVAQGFVAKKNHRLPDIDQRQKFTTQTDAKAAGLAHLHARQPEAKVDFDPIIGSPRAVISAAGFLSSPQTSNGPVSANTAEPLAAADPHRPTKVFLDGHRALFGHGAEVLADARVKRDFVTPHNGLHTVVWQQQVDNIGVFEGMLISHTTKKSELVTISSRFMPGPALASAVGTPRAAILKKHPPISATHATALAAQDIGDPLSPEQITPDKPQGNEQAQQLTAKGLKGPAHARLVWLPMNAKSLRLCWEIVFMSRAQGEMFQTLVDVETGAVLVRRNLTFHISEASYRVYTSHSPSPLPPGYGTPVTNQPPLVMRELITTAALNATASPGGWIDDGVNETRGNNVDAHLDRNGDDAPDLPRPQGSPNRVFDFEINLTQDPTNYSSASVAQLFYLCNWYHDKLYELGFTEAAGNYQTDNFGRGGQGDDAVLADAQDASDTNNADFSAAPDGIPGRMQMYLFNGAKPRRDGALDADVVLHEYTHGLSSRRVGGGTGLTSLQSQGMGEGWSDFYALSFLSQEGEEENGTHAMAAYVAYGLDGVRENYYYGMRRYPYTTDLSKNPLTFKDIDPDQATAHPGVPCNPAYPFLSYNADEVHNQGEVWCSMLWDARARMIKKYGWAEGNKLMLQLVTDGMNLSPPNPNFIEARDAILAADLVDTGGANYKPLWEAFARRGLGFSATSPASWTTYGVNESYDLADDLRVTPAAMNCRGPVGGPFTPGLQTWCLTNSGDTGLLWAAATSSNWLSLSQNSGVVMPGGPAAVIFASPNDLAYTLPAGVYSQRIVVTNLVSGRVQTRLYTLKIGQPDYFAQLLDDTSILPGRSFTFTPDSSTSFYSACVESIIDFPTDPAGGTKVFLGDDTHVTVALSGDKHVSLYKSSRSLLYIGSNGYITFGSGDTDNEETYQNQFWFPRVSGFLTDLDPSTNGLVSWKQLDDRAAVTWQNVPQFGMTNANNFQIEMFFDGRIRLSYLKMDSTHGIIGLSKGTGVPAGFSESQFSSYPQCGTTQAWLKISVPQQVVKGDGTLIGAGKISLSTSLSADKTVVLSSSDATHVTLPKTVTIPAGQDAAVFNLTIMDNGILDGIQTALITASAAGFSDASAFISVSDRPGAPLSLSLPSSVLMGSTAQGTVSIETTAQYDLGIILTCSATQLVQVPPIVIIPAGQTSVVFSAAISTNSLEGSQTVIIAALAANWETEAATMLVRRDAGNPGVVDHFAWSAIPSPQPANQPFPVTLMALDNLNNPAANVDSLTLTGVLTGSSQTLLSGFSPIGSSSFGTYTLGYSFTPNSNITITHVRTFGGAKVSIWSEDKTLLASVPVISAAGQWVETQLTNALALQAQTPYRVGVYTAGDTYSWTNCPLPIAFADGLINEVYYASTDTYPDIVANRLNFVDLRYVTGSAPVVISPSFISGSDFDNGIWTGNVNVSAAAQNLRLKVDDGLGHVALSNPFDTVLADSKSLSAIFTAGQFVISWPAPAEGYVLESSETLDSGGWAPVIEQPALIGGSFFVTNLPSGKAQFYRLKK